MIPSSVRRWVPLLLGSVALLGCKKDLDPYYTVVGEQIPTFLASPLGVAAKYAPGETVTFELQYAAQTSPLSEVRIYQRIEPSADSTLVQTIPYQPAFSRRKNADTLVVRYVVPTGPNKANVRVAARLTAQNGQSKQRAFFFRLAEPTPTVAVSSVTNLTAPGTSTPVPGDVVRYGLTLNDNGITSASSFTTPGILYKDLDSLVAYVTVGAGPERRAQKAVRLPASGAQTGSKTTVNVDAVVPAGSAGQTVTYRFEAKSRFAGTPNVRVGTATAATFTPGTATPLAAARTVTLSYTGTSGGDLAALDLTSFTAVPASGPGASKDLVLSSTSNNAVQLKALNTTRFAATTAAVYNAATLNSIRQVYLTAPAANQLSTLDNIAVGNAFVARLRGTDQYVIFTVTGLNRTSLTDVALTLAVKTL